MRDACNLFVRRPRPPLNSRPNRPLAVPLAVRQRGRCGRGRGTWFGVHTLSGRGKISNETGAQRAGN